MKICRRAVEMWFHISHLSAVISLGNIYLPDLQFFMKIISVECDKYIFFNNDGGSMRFFNEIFQ